MTRLLSYAPAAVLGVGAAVVLGLGTQKAVPLRQSLQEAVPLEMGSYVGHDVVVSDEELKVAGVTSYLMRTYRPSLVGSLAAPYSVYVGYYDRQDRRRTIHSPKNCLPGAGWEALSSTTDTVVTPEGVITANRYVLRNQAQGALVLYWYQGRNRIEADEYRVKWQLLRDAALHRRSEEALVRIVVFLNGRTEEEAVLVAKTAAAKLVPALRSALPLMS